MNKEIKTDPDCDECESRIRILYDEIGEMKKVNYHEAMTSQKEIWKEMKFFNSKVRQ